MKLFCLGNGSLCIRRILNSSFNPFFLNLQYECPWFYINVLPFPVNGSDIQLSNIVKK